MTQTLLGCIFALWLLKATAFVHQSPSFVRSSSQLNVFDPGSFPDRVSAASNFWISTIDSDIASIPNDQFGLVFAGGIVSDFTSYLTD